MFRYVCGGGLVILFKFYFLHFFIPTTTPTGRFCRRTNCPLTFASTHCPLGFRVSGAQGQLSHTAFLNEEEKTDVYFQVPSKYGFNSFSFISEENGEGIMMCSIRGEW